MTQSAMQVSESPPLSGLALVQQLNRALQTLATDFAGTTDPAQFAGPFMTWADTANGLVKRRNATNTAWVEIAGLWDRALKIASAAEGIAGSGTTALSPAGLVNYFGQNLNDAQGTMKFPNGKILKWGYSQGTGDFYTFFPLAFPNRCQSLVCTPVGQPPSTQQFSVSVRDLGPAGFNAANRLITTTVANVNAGFYYFAFGD